MVDFVKMLGIPIHSIEDIKKNALLDFNILSNDNTGEIKEYKAKYRDLTFQIKNNKYFNVWGSMHKFSQGGKNYNDFNFKMLFESIIDCTLLFNINPFKTYLKNLEFGVNLILSFNPDIIINSLITYKGKPFNSMEPDNKVGKYVELQRYTIKVYDKGLQSKIYDKNILRIEIRVKKMEHIKNIGVERLSDLLDIQKLEKLGNLLNSCFNEILFYDHSVKSEGLNDNDRKLLSDGENPKYWQRVYKRGTKKHDYLRRKFRSLMEKNSIEKNQKKISNLINEKYKYLLSDKFTKLTGFKNGMYSNIINSLNRIDEKHYFEFVSYYKNGQINHSGKELKQQICRYCKTCGVDISFKKKNAVFCEKRECRNRDSNKRRDIKKKLNKYSNEKVLFDPNLYLRITKEQTEILKNNKTK